MITAGIDCGAKYIKAVIVAEGKIIGKGKQPNGFDPKRSVEASLQEAIRFAGITFVEIQRILGTGNGANAISIADAHIDDIRAIAKGAHYFFPSARTVADIGAEEGRAARIDENGTPIDSAVNERCAAGAGVFIEAMARALDVTLEEMGSLYLQSEREIPMNAQCSVFAESEVVGLIHAGTAKADISKAVHDAIAGRIGSMIRIVGLNRDIVMFGGMSCSPGFRAAMQTELKVERIYVPDEPEFGAAAGTALLAAEEG